MITENIVLDHMAACERTYTLMLEENRLLKSASAPPPDDFLDKKRQALKELSDALAALQMAEKSAATMNAHERAAIQKTQQLVLKALLLDRENEQLLRKSLVVIRPRMPQVRPTLDQIQRLYRKHGISPEGQN